MKKQCNKGAGVKSGLSEQGAITESPKSMGMDTKGADQKPMPTPRDSAGNGCKFK